MVHTATGPGVVSSVSVLFWGIPRTGDGKSDSQTHLRARPSQTDQPAQSPSRDSVPCNPCFCYGWPAGRTMSFLYDTITSYPPQSEFGSGSSRESVDGLLVSLTTCSSIQTCLFLI